MRDPRVPATLLLLAGALLMPLSGRAEGDLYLDLDSYEEPSGLVTLDRPNEDWSFVDLAEQRRRAALEMPAARVDEAFAGLIARLHLPAVHATVSIFTFDLAAGCDLAACEAHVKKQVDLRKGTLREAVRGKVGTADVVRVDFTQTLEGIHGQPDGVYFMSRIDCPRPDRKKLVVLILEVPEKEYKSIKREYAKILKSLKLP